MIFLKNLKKYSALLMIWDLSVGSRRNALHRTIIHLETNLNLAWHGPLVETLQQQCNFMLCITDMMFVLMLPCWHICSRYFMLWLQMYFEMLVQTEKLSFTNDCLCSNANCLLCYWGYVMLCIVLVYGLINVTFTFQANTFLFCFIPTLSLITIKKITWRWRYNYMYETICICKIENACNIKCKATYV